MLAVIVYIPSIDFSYIFGRADTEEDGRAMVLDYFGSLDSIEISFQ